MTTLQTRSKLLKRRVDDLESRFTEMITSEGEDLPNDISQDLLKIGEKSDLIQMFWMQQQSALKNTKFGNRWHPSMIRFCIGLHTKSPGAYDLLRRSGVIQLPCSKTLRQYSYFTKPTSGFNPEVIRRIADDIEIDKLSDHQKNVILTFDEIHIRQGLVYSAETQELVGWIDTGDINNEISAAVRDDKPRPLAKQIMCIMIRGLFISLNHVVAFFPCVGFTGEELFFTIWKAVLFVEQVGFTVRALTCDGASSNRKFFKVSSTTDNHFAPHPLRSRKIPVYFISDVPHLMKTTRNNWENSDWNSRSRELMVSVKIYLGKKKSL